MSTEIETDVRNILCSANVTMKSVYLGLRNDALGGNQPMDAWVVTFHNETSKRTEDFDFFTGIGLRAKPSELDKRNARFDLPGLTERGLKERTIHGKRYYAKLETLRKPKAPEPASVLHGILLDSEACSQSFAHWCMDYGYDEDSRKAYATYEACQKNADKLARVLDHKTRDALRDALQDY